jgi:hypothetical protein
MHKKNDTLRLALIKLQCLVWDHDYKILRTPRKVSTDFVPAKICRRCGKKVLKENFHNKVKETVRLKDINFPNLVDDNNKNKEVSL